MRAVVLVSGGGAVTPFTTPDQAARRGLAAGNSLTALREHLLGRGHVVFTAPARIGAGAVARDEGWQGFDDVPEVLAAETTINAVGGVAAAGRALRTFFAHLSAAYEVREIDVVAHSMGGLFTRSALAGAEPGTPVVGRLVTLGTPWTGSLLGDFRSSTIALADAGGDAATERILREAATYADEVSQGAADEVSHAFLAGADGWNERQRGVLDGVDVTAVGGRFFAQRAAPSALWPHDGLVSTRSATCVEVSAEVLPRREMHEFDDVHSIFFADRFALPWERALTWDPRVADVVDDALRRPPV